MNLCEILFLTSALFDFCNIITRHQFRKFSLFESNRGNYLEINFWKNHWRKLKEIFLCQHKQKTFRFATPQVNDKHKHLVLNTHTRESYETFIQNDLSVKVTSLQRPRQLLFLLFFPLFFLSAAPQQHTNCQWMWSDWFFRRVAQCDSLYIFSSTTLLTRVPRKRYFISCSI